jgi:hypothetical protein
MGTSTVTDERLESLKKRCTKPWNAHEQLFTPNWCLKTSKQTIPAVGVVQEHGRTCRIAIYKFLCEHNRWLAGFAWLHSRIVQEFCLSSAFFCICDNQSHIVARTLQPRCEVASDVYHTYIWLRDLRSSMYLCGSWLHQNLPPISPWYGFFGISMFANKSLLNDTVLISWSLTCADSTHGSDKLIESLTV